MITIFVGGHGRCNEILACKVPGNVSIKWFGKLGNPVKKAFSSAVLEGKLTTMSGLSSAAYPPCEHYSCESVALENQYRAAAFQKGPWNKNTYLIQAKENYFVPLSKLIEFTNRRWPGDKIEFKWAVCRSSINYSGIVEHNFKDGQAVEELRAKTAPSLGPQQFEGDADGAIFVEQWNGRWSPTNYGTASEQQVAKTSGVKKHGGRFADWT